MTQWCLEKEKKFTTLEELFSDKQVKEEYENVILEDMKNIAKIQKLKPVEIPRKVIISSTPWNPENDLTTPTMKIKRVALKKKFQGEIESAYEEIEKN